MNIDEKAKLQSTLSDCRIDAELSDTIIAALEHGKKSYVRKCLYEHRLRLLSQLHGKQRQLETLDYFIASLR